MNTTAFCATLLLLNLPESNYAQTNYQRFKSFGFNESSAGGVTSLVLKDGAIYGATRAGGNGEYGTLFRMNKDGSGYVSLHHFSATREGSGPGQLFVAADNTIHGITSSGGANNGCGTAFQLDPASGDFTVSNQLNWITPARLCSSELLKGKDGMFFGIAIAATPGAHGTGSIFRVTADGDDFTVLRSFPFDDPDGTYPRGLTIGNDGTLFGILTDHGIGAGGFIFKLNPDGSGFQVLHRFWLGDPGVLVGSDPVIYGTLAACRTWNLIPVAGSIAAPLHHRKIIFTPAHHNFHWLL